MGLAKAAHQTIVGRMGARKYGHAGAAPLASIPRVQFLVAEKHSHYWQILDKQVHWQGRLASVPVVFAYCEIVMPRKTFEIAVADLTQAIGLLVRRVRAAATSHELSLTEGAVMKRLATGGPATTAELARAESMKPQSMGTTIAALEEMGMVARKPHPTDGRQVNIELTVKGAAVRKSARDAKRAWLTHAVAQLNERERKTLFAAGEIIKRLAEK